MGDEWSEGDLDFELLEFEPSDAIRSEEDALEACVGDLVADFERQGGLSPEDIERMVVAHDVNPASARRVLALLIDHGIEIDSVDRSQPLATVPARPSTALTFGSIAARYRLLSAEDEVALGRRIRLGQEAQNELDESDMENDERRSQVHDGRLAHQTLVLANLRLAMSIAMRHQGRGLDVEDLFEEALFGLLRAADKFDYTKGFKFSTYATWWIRQSIERGIANTARLVRLPVHYVEEVNKVGRVQRQLQRRYLRDPTLAELAFELDMEPGRVQAALDNARGIISLDAPVADGEVGLGALLASKVDRPDREVAARIAREQIEALLADYEDRTRRPNQRISAVEVLRRRTGLTADGRPRTLEEIGDEFGVTRERIRQIEKKALTDPVLWEMFRPVQDSWEDDDESN